ncbi:hypothetical protein EYF80_033631 [Liparis tanakae]|uniref:Uncharacterized protein n=1 Tax=Liparis tanakae TaxID=230148 RepID=A0A4Z2GRR3_9TELE|nr:hypothetical protein EYF80_033631 [Liparis tanakae]
MATGDPVHNKPPDIQHAGMVVEVEERDLSAYLVEHVEGQEREAQVVEHQEASAGVRLPPVHVLGPRPHDQKVHDRESEGGRVVVEQQPSSHPLI